MLFVWNRINHKRSVDVVLKDIELVWACVWRSPAVYGNRVRLAHHLRHRGVPLVHPSEGRRRFDVDSNVGNRGCRVFHFNSESLGIPILGPFSGGLRCREAPIVHLIVSLEIVPGRRHPAFHRPLHLKPKGLRVYAVHNHGS